MGDNRRFALEAGKAVGPKGEGAAHAVSATGNFRPFMNIQEMPEHMHAVPEARVVKGPPSADMPLGPHGDNDLDMRIPIPSQ